MVPIAAWALSRHVVESMYLGRRPAGLYTLVVDTDSGICKPVLRSLNQPFEVPKDPSNVLSPNLPGAMLLASDLEVPWQHKLVGTEPGPDSVAMPLYQGLDFVLTDLANDGHPLAVYRWRTFLSSRNTDDPLILRTPASQWSSQKILPDNVITELYKQSISPTTPRDKVLDDLENAIYPADKSIAGDALDFNVLDVGARIIILATGSIEANRGAYNGRPFQAFVLQYHPGLPASVLCELRGA